MHRKAADINTRHNDVKVDTKVNPNRHTYLKANAIAVQRGTL